MARGHREPAAGRPGTAAPACHEARRRAPDTELLHLLGVVALQAGRPLDAALLIGQAVTLCPGKAAYLCNLGEAYRAAGELAQALACQRQAIALDPALAVAHLNQGLALQALGKKGAAAASYQRALALEPALGRCVAPP